MRSVLGIRSETFVTISAIIVFPQHSPLTQNLWVWTYLQIGHYRYNEVKMKSYWITAGPKILYEWQSYKKRKKLAQRHQFTGRITHKNGSKDWNDASTNQVTVRIASKHHRLAEAKKALPAPAPPKKERKLFPYSFQGEK